MTLHSDACREKGSLGGALTRSSAKQQRCLYKGLERELAMHALTSYKLLARNTETTVNVPVHTWVYVLLSRRHLFRLSRIRTWW